MELVCCRIFLGLRLTFLLTLSPPLPWFAMPLGNGRNTWFSPAALADAPVEAGALHF